MAVTIQQQASVLTPAYNDAIYILSSNNTSQDNFKYVVDIYVGGVKVDRMLIPPHPTHLTGLANVAPLLESRVTKDILIGDDRILENTSSNVEYTLKFGEAYGTTGTTIYADLTVLTGKFMWNSVFDYEDYCVYSSGDYVSSSGSPTNFLTNKPSSGDVMTDDNAWLYFNDFALKSSYVKVTTRNSSLATIGTWNIANNITTKRFLRVPSGPANLNIIPNGQLSSGSQPIIVGTEYDYHLQAFDTANNAITNKYYYTLVTNCSRYTKKRFQFLNKLGGYDFFDFTLVSKDLVDIERSTYKKNLGSYASANSYTYSPKDRAITTFHTQVKDKLSIQSDWVRESVMAWLEELITSPDVLYDDGTYLIPVNITNTTFEKKKEVNEKLFNLSIEYTLSYDRSRQRI